MATTIADYGSVLSVQFLVAGQRAECVIPLADDSQVVVATNKNRDVCEAFVAQGLPLLLDCLAQDAQVIGVSAEGMVDGDIPFRLNFPLGSYEGTIAHDCVPQSIASLIAFYADPADVAPGNRTRVAKTMIPGVPETSIAGEIIDGALKTAVGLFMDLLLNGMGGGSAGGIWRRVMAEVRGIGATIRLAIQGIVRDYIASVKRRLLPH